VYAFTIFFIKRRQEGGTSKDHRTKCARILTDQACLEKPNQRVQALAGRLTSQIPKRPPTLDMVAQKAGSEPVQGNGGSSPGRADHGFGGAPEVTRRCFQLNPGEMSGPVPTQRGVVFMTA